MGASELADGSTVGNQDEAERLERIVSAGDVRLGGVYDKAKELVVLQNWVKPAHRHSQAASTCLVEEHTSDHVADLLLSILRRRNKAYRLNARQGGVAATTVATCRRSACLDVAKLDVVAEHVYVEELPYVPAQFRVRRRRGWAAARQPTSSGRRETACQTA